MTFALTLDVVSPLRFAALLVLVGLACWAIWPADAAHPQQPRTTRTITVTPPSTTTHAASATDTNVSVAGDDESVARVVLEGQVIDETKQPIGGATVRFGLRTTTTEGDGSFSFTDVIAGPVLVSAELGVLYGEETTTFEDGSDPIEITVRRGPTLVLHVLRKADGAPIANAKVELARRELYTDATGSLRARGLDPTGERFTIIAEGYGSWRGNADFDSEFPTGELEMTVKLASGAPISGFVVDERGERVPEAYVSLSALDGDWNDSVTADEHGAWTLPAIAAGRHSIYASSDIHLAAPDQILTLDGVHPMTGIVVHVKLGGELVGRVVDTSGKPVAGASVRGAPGPDTDADGRFHAVGLEPGETTISAYTALGASDEQKVVVSLGKPTEVVLVIRNSSLAGRAVDKAGQPIADASIYARSADENNTYSATTDEYGKFDFGGILPGTYSIIGQRDEESARRLPEFPPATYHTGRRDLTIVLPEIGGVTGRIVLDGAPVSYFGVYITQTPDRLYAQRGVTVSDPSGAFAQHDIAPGTWSVVVVGPGFATKQIDGIVVAEGGVTDVGAIIVDRGRTIRGRVTDAHGRPVANAFVLVGESVSSHSKDRVDQRAQGDASAHTDADGRYTLSGLTSSDTLWIVAKSGTLTSLERQVGLGDIVDLQLVETGTVVGHIASLDKAPLGVVVFTESEYHYDRSLSFSSSIDRASDFRVENLPPGRYEVRVIGVETLPILTVDVVANTESRVDFEAPPTMIDPD